MLTDSCLLVCATHLRAEMPKDIPGFRQEDVDGDGHITMMRIADPVRNTPPY